MSHNFLRRRKFMTPRCLNRKFASQSIEIFYIFACPFLSKRIQEKKDRNYIPFSNLNFFHR